MLKIFMIQLFANGKITDLMKLNFGNKAKKYLCTFYFDLFYIKSHTVSTENRICYIRWDKFGEGMKGSIAYFDK